MELYAGIEEESGSLLICRRTDKLKNTCNRYSKIILRIRLESTFFADIKGILTYKTLTISHMKRVIPALLVLLMSVPALAQQSAISSPDQSKALSPIDKSRYHEYEAASQATSPGNELPGGTVVTDVVTAVKIGSASNAFTFLIGENVQISAVQASDGDAIGFIYRQNISDCGGATVDNGLYRYSFSSDGGTTWNVGSAGTSTAATTPIGCYGFGVMNSNATKLGRYPNFLLSLGNNGTTLADVKGVYVGAALDPGFPTVTDWDGMIAGTVNNAATTSPTYPQEDYLFGNNDQYLPYHLIERVPGEYWYTTWDYDAGGSPTVGKVLKVTKGLYNSTTNAVDWTEVETISLPTVSFLPTGATDSAFVRSTPTIAFSPDGMTGYIAWNGDINDRDSVYLPVWMKSSDGGVTWGAPEEIKLRQFSELRELLESFWIVVDTTTGDTLPAGSGVPTTAFEHDLTVDKNGNPHFVCVVANGGANTSNGGVVAPNYTFYSGFRKFILDVTIDSFGDPNCLVIGDQRTFRGSFGLIGAGGSDEVTADPFVQASRSPDGSKVFFSWTDSDTTGAFGNSDNNNPNFITRGLDVDNLKVTTDINWTINDLNWVSRAVMPKTAPVALADGQGNYTVPTVVMDIAPNTSAVSPVSFWYFSDVSNSDSDFSNDISFFYNCKENPFSNVVTPTAPGCGLSDGSLSVAASGGLGSYTYAWGANAGSVTTPTVNGLSAGVYEVTITDSVGCSELLSVTLNDANAAVLAVDSTADITCFGDGNGYAEVNATPAMGATIASYLWSNGETTAIATMLPPGNSSVVVTDDQNCVSTISVSIDEPNDVSLSASATDANCFGEASGSVTSIASGGKGSIAYAWDTGDNTPSVSGLTAGMYTVTVTDANGCTKDQTVTVSQPDSLALNLSSNPNTNENPPYNGFATVSNTGGSDPVTFEWTGPGGYSNNQNIAFGLAGGMYFVTATDANGCMTSDSVFVDGPGLVSIDDELAAGINTMSIFPNPSQGVFSLNLELDHAQDIRVEILTLRGKLLSQEIMRNVVSVEKEVNLTHLTRGVYFIQVTTEQGTAGRKIVLR